MKTLLSIYFLLSLCVWLAAAKPKLSQAWDIDPSCDDKQRATLDAAFDETVLIITKTWNDLLKVQIPKVGHSTPSGSDVEWDRISRNLVTTFGLTPPEDPTKTAYNPMESNFARVLCM